MKDEKKTKLKKQILSGGLYIALAAGVVAITTRGITTILSGGNGYEAPDFSIEDNLFDEQDYSQNLKMPEIPNILDNDYYYHYSPDKTVSDYPDNVDAQLTDPQTKSDIEEESPPEKIPEQNAIGTQENENSSEEKTSPEKEQQTSAEPEYPTEPEGITGYSLYVKPVNGYINREFSPDVLIYSPTMYDYRTHNGIDIAADPGTPVKAFAAGSIKEVYEDPLMGTSVVLDHGDGLTSHYMNLYESIPSSITQGAWINVGETIGGIGESAISEIAEVPHLHFEIRKNGIPQDPSIYLRESSIS